MYESFVQKEKDFNIFTIIASIAPICDKNLIIVSSLTISSLMKLMIVLITPSILSDFFSLLNYLKEIDLFE